VIPPKSTVRVCIGHHGNTMSTRKQEIEAIIEHLKDKSPEYRKTFERLLVSGGKWDPKLQVFECFGRFIKIDKDGLADEL